MKKHLLILVVMVICWLLSLQNSYAQSWDLNGNSNVTTTSKLGSTTNIAVKLFTGNKERLRIQATGTVGIGTPTPASSAILDITSVNRGLLVPRMTSLQRLSIVSPANSLLVFDTDTHSYWFYNATAWNSLITGTTGGSNNLFIGMNTGRSITTASDNVGVGADVLQATTTGSNNTATGYGALYSNTTGYSNTAFGYVALGSNETSVNNVAIGDSALYNHIGSVG